MDVRVSIKLDGITFPQFTLTFKSVDRGWGERNRMVTLY